MKIWVDADACPVVMREILFRASERLHIPLTLIANQFIKTPPSPRIQMRQVMSGFDVADNEIVRLAERGDLVITSDIPLAAEVIANEALVLTFRGERLTKDNIQPRLNMRDFMDTMRSSGIQSGGEAPLNLQDRKKFADQLDKLLARTL